jgi:O-antigen/teichoic acid export membrane protein
MSLLRNSLANLLGGMLPALVLLVTIPIMVLGLGPTNYGLLTLVGAITGYFSIIDINLTAGSVKFVSEYRTLGDRQRESETIILGLAFYLGLGLVGAGALLLFAEPLALKVFDIPTDQRMVAVSAMRLAALGFLISQVQQYLNSLPQAIQQYNVTAKLESVFGVLVPVASVVTLHFGAGLLEMIEIRIVGSALHAMALGWWCRRLYPELRLTVPSREVMARVLSFSAYAYLSKLASVSYAYADKLIIGARIGVSALTYFVVPSTLASRLNALAFRLSSVMFPHASALAAAQRLSDLERDYLMGSRYMFFINGAVALTLSGLAHPILSHWLNPDFARAGTIVMVIVALTLWLDSLTNLPSLVNDGLGHPHITGWFAVVRVFVGLGLVFTGVGLFGIVGAAIGHLVAAIIGSAAFLIYVHGRSVPISLSRVLRESFAPPCAVLLPLGALTWQLSFYADRGWFELFIVVAVLSLLYIGGAWIWVVYPSHRLSVLHSLRKGLARE